MFERFRGRITAITALGCVVLAGCARGHASEPAGSHREPATVIALDDHSGRHSVQLTEDGASRIGLATDTVRATVGPGLPGLTVAAAAVLYDENGVTWVYVQTAPLTFQRARVAVSRVDGDTAVLRSGPPAGTTVATVGVAELRGVEEGVPGE